MTDLMQLTQERSIAEFFDQPDAPAEGSPVGTLMQKIHAEFPDLDLETIRAEAREALLGVGGAHRIAHAYQRWLSKHRSSARTTYKARFSTAAKA